MASLPYIAHSRQDGAEQLLSAHLIETAELARGNAAPWGEAFANVCGLAHDVGKYSEAFQNRIRGKKIRVDHATAGGQLLYKMNNRSILSIFAAYCVMGHHGGLPNGGSGHQDTGDDPTLYGRLRRHIGDYDFYKNELDLPRLDSLPPQHKKWEDGFEAAFFVRMAFSALVDADWLNTEKFCNFGNAPRGGFSTLPKLVERLTAHTEQLLNPVEPIGDLNKMRNNLLRNCLAAAAWPRGLFKLTAPTGSGKTIASLAFALNHAERNGQRRLIYVVPYNTIIEQNAAVFEELLGVENVLRHNSDAAYDGDDEESVNKRNSIENWDYPLIVTSSVQFFESLFANSPSKCRKLHNIAESVLIFDEAQMIPISYLSPCVRAIKTLVSQYGCSAVLATATQSPLDEFFKPLQALEIAENPKETCHVWRRATIKQLVEPLTDEALVDRLSAQERVLGIINTRRQAQVLFVRLHKLVPEGTFHLSTTMYPVHRKRVLDSIRKRLKNGLACRVVSTSLVEAGVDLDFETVYRERAGLDSIVQAAGRCNRENKRKPEAAFVYVFVSAEHKPPRMIRPNIDAFGQIARKYDDLSELDAIEEYFLQLYYNIGKDRLDSKCILPLFNDGAKAASFRFADAAAAFKLIDDQAQQTVYVLPEAPDIEERVVAGERSRELFRALGGYGVSLFEQEISALEALGAVWRPDRSDKSILLLYKKYYDEQIGVTLSPGGGLALFG